MKRTLVVVAAVVGFAAAASAGTLSVFTTDAGNVAQTTFTVGDTILLKVSGDGQGNTTEDSLAGTLIYNGSITNTLGMTEFKYLPASAGNIVCPDPVACPAQGSMLVFNQTGGPPIAQSGTSVITMLATGAGTSTISWGGTLLDFFGIYSYSSSGISINTGASFTIVPAVPEPTTAALIGLGLLGLGLGGRRRA